MKSLRMIINPFIRMSILLTLLTVIVTINALKDVIVSVPVAAKIMDTVTLQCKYDMEGEAVYTVKWYKGQKEFFRYLPKELPAAQVFPLPGIDVDLSKSVSNENQTKIVLRNVQPEVTGRYKCEVSSDPNFYTHVRSGFMYVIDAPLKDPVLVIEKEVLEIGSTLKGNCTTPPSFPAVNITWFLNDKKINESYLKHIPDPNTISTSNRKSRVITVSGLELEIDSNTFQSGKARLKCVASVFNLYRREEERVLDEERPRPRPSSVLGNRDSASASSALGAQFVINIVLLLFVCLR